MDDGISVKRSDTLEPWLSKARGFVPVPEIFERINRRSLRARNFFSLLLIGGAIISYQRRVVLITLRVLVNIHRIFSLIVI